MRLCQPYQCDISGCPGTPDHSTPIALRDGSFPFVCEVHYEAIIRVLGEQVQVEAKTRRAERYLAEPDDGGPASVSLS
jgi:hypothetical protein